MRPAAFTTFAALALATGLGPARASEPLPPLEPQPDPIPGEPLPPPEPRPRFESFDLNRDGQIAPTEIPEADDLVTLFAHFDLDQDQYLTRTEFEAYAAQWEEAR